ncbi:Acetyl-CoA:oxalate CoA-transferase [Paraburkholderia domus]|jgi:Predicted acyl-CoA transferases/carnitine dehydratase|uniref:Acetyl-CoA:oxalate CoA-transferase n=1 Tax=Paraburkholderia domus TaxID=2793075 RepID=A0A9N8NF52_9BURK|nr:CaiB/BaiF CoA-transferase family protein [Paraburkholderia domus]MBK5053930.1 CoA transferase [Burkholderia sp. R-70006]MBK5063941.1 CoA transferase [Burkholderia sp. R-70199]MBK5090066.1 CoA transferase [Burkholderia sp. R-69927]MBK5125526.1 CoA transferase [Burkholderia sp. R-69980]MBK5169697.1 CoA transferase [Burkholderia sp. R-70211]MBK5185399.1 CoA transferase [Burkholderia sp. R-69749]MCI0150139.1 CoA transferase [Paraburkholderia sediminicola]
MGVLDGIRVVEIAGIGPGPFCGMLLADMGAEVILIERADANDGGMLDLGKSAIVNRGKQSIALNLKDARAIDAVLRLIEGSDALIEGMRPGVMERLGLGPDMCLARNPRLVYGRMTGWGQTGPLAQAAGHDLNYIALSGALWFAGEPGNRPMPPPTLVGDLGGGALYLAMGVLAGILGARRTGHGQVVDAAIVDGSANLMNLLLSVHAAGHQPIERGSGLLDGPHWSGTYACADGHFVSVQALEPQFNALLFNKLGLGDDPDFRQPYHPHRWQALRERLAAVFATQPRQHWVDLLEGSDACFAPVLTPVEAMTHPHMAARGVYAERDGVLQAAPAPRFSATPSGASNAVPQRGEHGAAILRTIGLSENEIAHLLSVH